MNDLVDALLLAIEHRGGDSTGLLALSDDGSVEITKTTERAPMFVATRDKVRTDARTVLLHTRYATKGAIIKRNAHPVTFGTTSAIHNGMIYNDDALFREFGMKRTAEVDSIVIPAIVDYFGWEKADKGLSKLRGGAAVALVNSDHPDELLLARTRGAANPLHVLVTKTMIVWASERTAIEVAWQRTYGTRPRGEWLRVAEWTMVRVNGKIETTLLEKPPIEPITKWPPRKTTYVTKTRAKKGKQRKAGTRTYPSTHTVRPTAQLAMPLEHEPYMDDAVRDLMKWADCDYEDAYEAVYGVMPPDDDPFAAVETSDDDSYGFDRDAYDAETMEWIDDILTSRSTLMPDDLNETESDYRARRRREGWKVGA